MTNTLSIYNVLLTCLTTLHIIHGKSLTRCTKYSRILLFSYNINMANTILKNLSGQYQLQGLFFPLISYSVYYAYSSSNSWYI